MFDTWSGEDYFGGGGWCRSSAPSAGFVHMGISPDKGDFYNAQLADQWIDVTGLPPGDYTLRATVNPPGTIIEASTANNVLDVTRTIPGAIANDTSGTAVSGFGSTITLGGSVIGDDISSVANGSCNLYNSNCYTTASPSTLTYTVVDSPDHGTVTINGTGLSAAATYTSQAGYTGQDSFTYTTTDSRGFGEQPCHGHGPVRASAASGAASAYRRRLHRRHHPRLRDLPLLLRRRLRDRPRRRLPQPRRRLCLTKTARPLSSANGQTVLRRRRSGRAGSACAARAWLTC